MTLLHVCCGPCAVYPSRSLRENGYRFDAYFCNPNIYPLEEFVKREENVLLWAEKDGVRIHVDRERSEDYWSLYRGAKSGRCDMCYRLRAAKVFDFAKNKGYDSVTTTLLVSPYQDQALIKSIFEECAEARKVKFLYFDFRTGYREGQELAKELGLYRQKYCGCLPSLDESSYFRKKKQREIKKDG